MWWQGPRPSMFKASRIESVPVRPNPVPITLSVTDLLSTIGRLLYETSSPTPAPRDRLYASLFKDLESVNIGSMPCFRAIGLCRVQPVDLSGTRPRGRGGCKRLDKDEPIVACVGVVRSLRPEV